MIEEPGEENENNVMTSCPPTASGPGLTLPQDDASVCIFSSLFVNDRHGSVDRVVGVLRRRRARMQYAHHWAQRIAARGTRHCRCRRLRSGS